MIVDEIITPRLTSPAEYIDIEHRIDLMYPVNKKIDLPEDIKATALATLNDRYPESDWLRIFTDGSLINNRQDAGAGIHCQFFSQYIVLDKHANHYDGELEAIRTALQNILYRPYIQQKIVILSDSKSAIEAIVNYTCKTIHSIQEIRSLIKSVKIKNEEVILQWIPAHVGIMGNEYADQLAKKGAMVKRKPTGRLEIHKQINKIKHQIAAQQELHEEELLKDKLYQNIKNRTDLFNMPRKTAVALFRMETGHDCLAEHLYRINCLTTPICSLCDDDAIMNRHHLGECKSLTNSSLAALYWEARGKMMQIN